MMIEYKPDGDPREAKYLVYGLGLPIGFISFICSCYILVRVYLRYKRKGSLPVAVRFPFYLALIEMYSFINIAYNQLHVVLTGHLLPGESCRIGALFFSFGPLSHYIMVAVYSTILYFQIGLTRTVNTGKYDWKLLLVVFGGAIACSFAIYNDYGASRYWCFCKNGSVSSPIMLVYFFFETVMFITIVVFYYLTMTALRKLEDVHRSRGAGKSTAFGMSTTGKFNREEAVNQLKSIQNIENIMSKKMMGYITNFFIQWCPVVVYIASGIFNYYPDWVYVICNIGLNSGGWLNLITYIKNEGWNDK
ncbi:hypothetical protein BC833DRAFT_623679 [Globomyces pollinis-pini]|nr:hypothetical protein BC833DRAFT_623679 [Globomyces pollinis-pini]